MKQIQILRETKNKDFVGIACIECNINKITVARWYIERYEKALIEKDQWDITYNYNNLMCDTCKSNLEDIADMDKKEQIEINNREQILESEYRNNIRQKEPNKNKYCRIKNKPSYEYEKHYNYLESKWNKHESDKSYVFLCGRVYPLEYWTLETVTKEHLKNCNICKVLTGSKRTKGFTQFEVNELFRLGITDKSSSSKNFESKDNTVWHYRTIEKIRTENNTIIDNSQCWSGGFAHCEANLGKASLPLTSLSGQGFDIYSIKVLDKNKKDFSVLFTIRQEVKHYAPEDTYKTHEVIKRTAKTVYLLFGRDDGQNFLVELFDKPKTIKEAYKSMLPLEALNRKNVLRQGDLFFIPTNENFKEYGKQYFQNLPIDLTYDQEVKMNELIQNKIGNRFLRQKQDYYSNKKFIIKDATTRLIAQYTELDYLATIKPKKELIRNTIFDTNHESQFMKIIKDRVYVKGQIIHTNRQHQKLILDKWYQVVKNRTKASYTVQRFGGMGRD